MNRTDFQALARLRLREARALRDRQLWSGCYYLSGHAVECALKACIARSTRRHDFPDKERAQKVHTHNLIVLLGQAGLNDTLKQAARTRAALEVDWALVANRWDIDARYNSSVTASEALDLYRAARGVVTWLRQHW